MFFILFYKYLIFHVQSYLLNTVQRFILSEISFDCF